MLLNPLHYVLARDLDPAAASSVSGPRFRSGLGSSSSSSCSASWSFFFFLAFFFFLSFFFFFFSSSVPEEEVGNTLGPEGVGPGVGPGGGTPANVFPRPKSRTRCSSLSLSSLAMLAWTSSLWAVFAFCLRASSERRSSAACRIFWLFLKVSDASFLGKRRFRF